MPDRTCTIDGCEKPVRARGLCGAHYERNRRNGTPGAAALRTTKRVWLKQPCSVAGCERTYKTNGYCSLHFQRWRKWGDPLYVGEQYGPMHPAWLGDAVGYLGAHGRVARLRGPATDHSCESCGSPAHEWAYDHADPNELTGSHGPYDDLAYSADPLHYAPMCRHCHRMFDNAHRRAS